MTSYTVNYVDENGNELAPSRTYYGNVGDRPVVAYLYMDGYHAAGTDTYPEPSAPTRRTMCSPLNTDPIR